jgi:hypothetical protein
MGVHDPEFKLWLNLVRFVRWLSTVAERFKAPTPAGKDHSRLGRQGTERHIQDINESSRMIGQLNLATQLLSKRFHHAGAKASADGRLGRRATCFGPCQAQPLGFVVDCPRDFETPGDTENAPKFVIFVDSSLNVIASAITAVTDAVVLHQTPRALQPECPK